VKVIEPVNLELSVPPVKYFNIRVEVLNNKLYIPQVSSPFNSLSSVRGSKETAISWALIVPCEKRLSVTVGISVFVAGLKVSK
jgi:hypothetical protein